RRCGCSDTTSMNHARLPEIPLPAGIRSRFVEDVNGLRMHVLEAGQERRGGRSILLLHGFPELAFSWRKVMPALASAGYHVIAPPSPRRDDPVHRELAALPRPRKHYQWYYSTREADADMHRAPQGVHDFLRAYYHHKSADWKGNQPYPLKSWTAGELAKLPTYYVMDLARNMAETVAEEMPDTAAIADNKWLPDNQLAFYSAEYARTGFQGGLQWYRCGTS